MAPELFGTEGESPGNHPDRKFWQLRLRTVANQLRHSLQKPISPDFVNLSSISGPRLSVEIHFYF